MNGCNENAIEFMTNGTKATLTFSQGRYKSVIRKLSRNILMIVRLLRIMRTEVFVLMFR